MNNKGKFDGICATEGCNNPSRWMSSVEVRALGSEAPYRCTTCCDAIGEAFHNVSTHAPTKEKALEALHKTLSEPYKEEN